MKECKRHDWRVGSFMGVIRKTKSNNIRIKRVGIHIWCYKCGKKIKAYYRRDHR